MPSSGALFGNNVSRSQNKNLVEFKAGKMSMKGKMVHPDKRKGLLYVYQSDDSLMHFCWKDRVTGVVEDVSIFLLITINFIFLIKFCICTPLSSLALRLYNFLIIHTMTT